MKKLLALILLATTVSIASPLGMAQEQRAVRGLPSELVRNGFNTFLQVIIKAQMDTKLTGGAYTVFAPNDVAFSSLSKAQLDALYADQEKLAVLVSHHVVEGKLSTAELQSKKVKTLGGSEIELKTVDGKLMIGTARLYKADLPTANGVIHGVDMFLQQP
jgi:uncharacterized surface protein with fasciclin (FAS1) repeats